MRRVWIDTDMGFDDLAAILTIAASPNLSISGLSLVAGNAPLDVVADNAARAAALFGWNMPIHRGRDRPIERTLVTAAYVLGAGAMPTAGRTLPKQGARLSSMDGISALIAELDRSQEALTILALGPLTNLAVALLARPDLTSRVERVVWMGGSVGRGNHTASAEFNAAVDPEAVQIVLNAGVPFKMIGLDVCRQVQVTGEDAERLRNVGGEIAHILADLLAGYVGIARRRGGTSMALYDPTAAAALIEPGAVTCQPAHLAVECTDVLTQGRTIVEWQVPEHGSANAEVAVAVDESAVRRIVLDALAGAAGLKVKFA